MKSSDLFVVGAYANPRRFKARLALALKWLESTQDSGATVIFVQHGFGERPYDIDPLKFPHVQFVNLRGGPEYELWLRDAMIMRGIAAAPEGAKYFAWEDADIEHLLHDWAMETLHMLQHNRVGQTWTHSVDMDPLGNVATNEWGNDVDRSFCAAWLAGEIDEASGNYAAPGIARALLPDRPTRDWRSHAGYSWAIRRDALNGIGRLMDWMVTGASDYHMALGFCGKLRQLAHDEAPKYSAGYTRRLLEFADRCDMYIKQDIGVVPGTVAHGWHGSKKLRFYGAREKILTESQYDPDKDLGIDANGLPYLVSDNRKLRDGLRRYQAIRNEDSIEVY